MHVQISCQEINKLTLMQEWSKSTSQGDVSPLNSVLWLADLALTSQVGQSQYWIERADISATLPHLSVSLAGAFGSSLDATIQTTPMCIRLIWTYCYRVWVQGLCALSIYRLKALFETTPQAMSFDFYLKKQNAFEISCGTNLITRFWSFFYYYIKALLQLLDIFILLNFFALNFFSKIV